jgi:aspartyl protease family protein
MQKLVKILGAIILLNACSVWANQLNVVVVGLFSGHAVVTVNGKQHFLKQGQVTPEGVKLIKATSKNATLEVNGQQKQYALGQQINGSYEAPKAKPIVSLWPINNMYLTPGSVNGFSINFLVDTGASTIAMNAATAKRLGLDYLRVKPIAITTASGHGYGYPVTLDYVQVGQIKLHNIEAVVLDGAEPSTTLLGMTFLGQLDMERKGQRLDLKQKF